ncbi:hypothetical protein BWK67_05470 [Campylobacter fetus]|nr:hypothetical protein BWK67_05470 [Campylobacter fetus]RUT50053.1 hypothetical protein BWK51_05450 [Campylobacter fetus]
MMKQILILLVFISFLNGRDNPFVPTDINSTDLISTNMKDSAPPFETQIIKFPSDARELTSIVFYYKSIDGSIKQKVVDINGSFDWHDEFVLKNQITPNKTASKILDVSVTTVKADNNSNKNDKPSTKISNLVPKIEPPLKSLSFNDMVKFDIYAMKINIFTADPKIRDFVISKPDKIVIDFKRKNADFNTKTIKVDKGAVKKLTFGAHDGYYRVVISLDGNYHYGIRQSDGGYTLILR